MTETLLAGTINLNTNSLIICIKLDFVSMSESALDFRPFIIMVCSILHNGFNYNGSY